MFHVNDDDERSDTQSAGFPPLINLPLASTGN